MSAGGGWGFMATGSSRSLQATLLLVSAGPFGPLLTSGNWLLQCSGCVDQAYFGDYMLKTNVKDAELETLFSQLKQVRLREFDHKEDEFYNKFFSKTQLGIIAQEVQSVMPNAVANVPERRWTTMKGMSNVTKNVLLLRDSHLLMVALGSLQLLGKKADHYDLTIDKILTDLSDVVAEQQDNRKKREEMLDQIIRVIAKLEVMQHTMTKTEEGFVRLDTDVRHFKVTQEEKHTKLAMGLEQVTNRTDAQDTAIAVFKQEFRAAVDREARADLVEKRKSSEADVEVQIVKRSIEKLRWEEEQKTIQMRADEQRRSEDHSSKLHQDRVAHELAQKKAADLALMHEQEASNLRQEETKRKGEKELLLLKLESEEKRAEIDLQRAVETAKIEQEAKIRAARENEDVNLREKKQEWQEKKQQTLAAIRETANIAASWVSSVYRSPQNLLLAIGSIIICLGGVYFAREMAILFREQLNKRLGRPSLVRQTNRRGFFNQFWIGLLRFLRLRAPLGSEFADVVLHPTLHQQVMRLADATRSAKKRGMPLMHVMFYGPPGTGKTMVAQRFAEYSGLEYAIMSGGDVAPLEEQAVTELHKLFKWVHRSRRGVLLFIDEADAFLSSRKRGTMSEPLRNALTTMLYHTGTPSSQFMMVLATNRPHDLDSAVLDRIDESVEFGLPDTNAREDLVKLYFKKYITQPLKIKPLRPEDLLNGKQTRQSPKNGVPKREDLVAEDGLVEVARKIHGFSGREISKLMTSLQTHILFSENSLKSRSRSKVLFLERKLLFEVVDAKVLEHQRTAEFQVTGYDYVNQESRPGSLLPSPKGGLLASPKHGPQQSPSNGQHKPRLEAEVPAMALQASSMNSAA
jgi:ATPase family AAA domain-containing protein 3A/B